MLTGLIDHMKVEGFPIAEKMNDKNGADINSEKEMQSDELIQKFNDPSYLPRHEDIEKAFKDDSKLYEKWFKFCFNKEKPVFELINREFIEALGDYLIKRAKELSDNSHDETIVILEVGAGSGRLTHFLKENIEKKATGTKIKFIATDSGDLGIKSIYPVEDQVKYQDAIKKYDPKIILVSWMPFEEDWTKDFRDSKSVEEYILIGEANGGCCGDKWKTWGCQSYFDNDKKSPYEEEGFAKNKLDDISRHQICRADDPGKYGCSSTVSFRRIGK